MSQSSRQPGLFDTDRSIDRVETVAARARMREMIERLRSATVPPWTEQTGVFLLDGAFKRAMPLVPAEEAEALWVEFDRHMERLYAVWAKGQPAPET
jgi:hypothetical protein